LAPLYDERVTELLSHDITVCLTIAILNAVCLELHRNVRFNVPYMQQIQRHVGLTDASTHNNFTLITHVVLWWHHRRYRSVSLWQIAI